MRNKIDRNRIGGRIKGADRISLKVSDALFIIHPIQAFKFEWANLQECIVAQWLAKTSLIEERQI